MVHTFELLQLPNEVLDKILLYLSYDEIANNRVVCTKFNVTCGQLLNRGFLNMERKQAAILKKVKSVLPRRESERRIHELARHSDILTAIETRISMLRMTFMKYIEINACCFIPGMVIDEILRILRLIEGTLTPPRTHEVLQELRDLSSMAMEHFDEKIAPSFKTLVRNNTFLPLPEPHVFSPLPTLLQLPQTRKDVFRKDMHLLQQRTFHQKKHIKLLQATVGKLILKIKKQNTIIHSQTTKIKAQSLRIKHQDTSIADLKRHVEEWDLKFADLVAELSRARDETSSTSTVTQPLIPPSTCCIAAAPSRFETNIKPRSAQILPRRLIEEKAPFEPDRKRKLGLAASVVPIIPTKMTRKSDDDDMDDIKNVLQWHNENYNRRPPFMSMSLETLLNSPINSVKSRKRKSQ